MPLLWQPANEGTEALRVEGPSPGHPASKQGSWALLGSPGNASGGTVLVAITEVQIQGLKQLMS